MAQMIDDTPVKMGYLIPVRNTQRVSTLEGTEYYALKVEDFRGDDERWLLLTEGDVRGLSPRVEDGSTRDWKPGRIMVRMATRSRCWSNLLKVVLPKVLNPGKDEAERTVLVCLPEAKLARGLARAKDNPEDVPSQGILADMMD